MSSFIEFFKAGIKNPRQLSTMFQTGPMVAKRFVRHVHLKPEQILMELGVGAGSITQHLLPHLSSAKQFVGFELNDDLVQYLRAAYPHLEIHHDSAEFLSQYVNGRSVGAVVSTLPWTLIPRPIRRRILSEVYATLAPGGVFCTYISLHVLWTSAARDTVDQIHSQFDQVNQEIEMVNIPPCRVFICRKS